MQAFLIHIWCWLTYVGLCDQVTHLFTGYVGAMLGDYAANPAGAWKSKDCAVYLIVALAVRSAVCRYFCAKVLR